MRPLRPILASTAQTRAMNCCPPFQKMERRPAGPKLEKRRPRAPLKISSNCYFAAANLLAGKNVLYITMEMAEERIAQRIDSNLLNIPIAELKGFPKKIYDDKINRLRLKTGGKLIIKEYPTATAGSGHFRHLLNELNLKKNFRPDIIYIDYLNICASSRLKFGANVNSYSYIKAIAEELRGLAVEKNLPIVSATQINRSGSTNTDPGL